MVVLNAALYAPTNIMASLQTTVDAVKAATTSISTCSATTVVTLKELLNIEPYQTATTHATKSSKAGARASKPPPPTSTRRETEQLSSRDRTVLATHTINAAIKALSELAKTPAPCTASKKVEGDGAAARPTGKRTLARSTSAPLSPIPPRALNRVATSPVRNCKASPAASPLHSSGCLALVECARAAFSCLRSLKGPLKPDQSDFQLENGMSAFAGKLVALGMYDQALKELKLLRQRFDVIPASVSKDTAANPSSSDAASTFAGLLEFPMPASTQSLGTITGCQVQTLKLIAAIKKPTHIESILPILDESHPSSPFNLLQTMAKDGSQDASKSIRQIASLSQLVLSLAPSISSTEDVLAAESRLSPSPIVAFQLQSLTFRSQLIWWTLADHKAKVDEELLSPFLRCLRTLARRFTTDDSLLYDTMVSNYERLSKMIKPNQNEQFKASVFAIHHVLGSTAHAAKRYTSACKWFLELKTDLEASNDSSVRYAAILARYLAAALKLETLPVDIEDLAKSAIDGLDGTLSGTAAELNELLDSLSLARRSVVGLLMKTLDPNSSTSKSSPPNNLDELLKSFILWYPRFVRRWLGNAPSADSSAKLTLQFDQRRQLVLKTISQTLDSTLVVAKCDIQAESLAWPTMDEILQHCCGLLDSVADPTLSAARAEQLGNYYVKISSLYFLIFSSLRKVPDVTKEMQKKMVQSLSRSIDVVKDRSAAERERGQLSTKLELFADLCKGSGKADDAIRTLRSICTDMAEDGVMRDVALALASKAPDAAWNMSAKTNTLSRTLRSIAKLDRSWHDWTFFLPESERAAVLEHLLRLDTASGAHSTTTSLHSANSVALLRIYSVEKYPIRRLRVLLHILSQNLGESDGMDELISQVDQALRQIQAKDKAEDSSLCDFIPHLQAYSACVRALMMSGLFNTPSLDESLDSWERMVASCKTKDDIYRIIDDPEGWLAQLQALKQLAGLRGDTRLQLRVAKLLIAASKLFTVATEIFGDRHVTACNELAAQYIINGSFTNALQTLTLSASLTEQYEGLPPRTIAASYLLQAEYYAGIGNNTEALNYLAKAKDICYESQATWKTSKNQAAIMMSKTYLVQSVIALQTGDLLDALHCSKTSVRLLSHCWSKLESALSSSSNNASNESTISDSSSSSLDVVRTVGPQFWTLASPLLRSLLHLSSVYAHVGMFQETVYYAESASKVAASTESPLYIAQVAGWIGSIYLRAGKMDKATSLFQEAESRLPTEACSSRVRLAQDLAEFYSEKGDVDSAAQYLTMAEETANNLNERADGADEGTAPADNVEAATREIEPTSTARGPSRRAVRTTKPKPTTSKTGVKRINTYQKSAPAIPQQIQASSEDIYQASLIAGIMLSQAAGYIRQKDWASALSTLERVKGLPKFFDSAYQEPVIMAMSLIGNSMEQIISDPVFSVMQDSTISFPAISALENGSLDSSTVHKSPAKRGRAATVGRRAPKGGDSPTFANALKQAQDLLVMAHESAMKTSNSGMVRRISTLLQSTNILLSAASTTTPSENLTHLALGTVAVDLAHNITWGREQKVLGASFDDDNTLSSANSTTRDLTAVATHTSSSLSRFQKSYIDCLPQKWSVISMSLSENEHDLCITKFQTGTSPFILRLPLRRANSRDADSEIFGFEHGKQELLDIIKLANETSHSARDFSVKSERNAWWAEREALDLRLKELLDIIEATWLGGFKGIFSQHQHNGDLLARFQKSFQQILDSNLPSRSGNRGKKGTANTPITLDSRILELFIGLGDPSDPDTEFDEALNDLLYFVVDILQFHGERNAYDEIDFDAMVVETYDALRAYYCALKTTDEREDGAHTILVLDKTLHAFPWESLPCMINLSVSRVPSLACLQQLLEESQGPKETTDGAIAGHYVSANKGTYILNPSSDLKNTQSYFQKPFKTLSTWASIVNKEPEEAEFEKALSNSDVFVYFGHGSGSQYIRGKTIRRLDKCRPATFLMGCSSAALTEAGEFECYGPVWNYMMAGCPAVVGTLWDVTDRDIDRFAGRAFEEWGLFKRGTFKESGSNISDDTSHVSLPEAVARARTVCRLRYLNAAAVVMYGIPTYLDETM